MRRSKSSAHQWQERRGPWLEVADDELVFGRGSSALYARTVRQAIPPARPGQDVQLYPGLMELIGFYKENPGLLRR